MLVGVPREVKVHEYRVGLTPASVRELVAQGHQVLVETGAGAGIGFPDAAYTAAGAAIAPDAATVFARAALVVKVKEPQPEEWRQLRPGQLLFTYLHLAPDPAQAEGLMQSGCTALAYETVTDPQGGLPLLAPMSEVAGRMAVQVGAHCLEREQGGAGILLGGVPGVPPAKVVVLGGGVAGTNAARMAVGLEASVTIIDKSLPRLKELDLQFGPRATTLFATSEAIEHAVLAADLVIGAVLVRVPRRQNWSRERWCGRCGRAPFWWTSPSIRAAVSRPAARPPIARRRMWMRASCITASPTCRGRWRVPPRSR